MNEKQKKPGSFVLFKNDYKKNGDNQPDYKSSNKEGDRGLDLNGKEIEVACWVNKSSSGVSYMSCNIQYPQQKETAPATAVDSEETNPDLPF